MIKPPAFTITSAVNRQRWLNMLVYAKPGAGKSTLVASAVDVPEMENVLMIDAESGELSLENNKRIVKADGIDRIRCTSFMQVAHVQEFLKAHCKYRDEKNMDGLRLLESRFRGCQPSDIVEPRIYKTVLIDSLTEINQFSMYEQMGQSIDMKLTDAKGDAMEMEVARFEEFRKNNQMMQLLVRAYRDLPMHVLATCVEQYTQDEMKKFHYMPAMTGKLAQQIQGFFDIVGYMKVGAIPDGATEAPRRLFVQPVGAFDAKNRIASFKGSYLDNPTMTTVMSMFKVS